MIKYLFFIVTLFVLLLSSCKQNNNTNQDDAWSSFETLSIPLEIRQAEFDKGNITPNFSFEEGENLEKTDTLIKNFNLESWTVVGDNVQWTDTASLKYNAESVSLGNKAIKIERRWADVKDIDNQTSGVLSDFIEIIPGNYLFYFDVRMLSVHPSCDRLNSKLGTDIDVRIKYFDKDKKEMSAGIYYDYWDKNVDNEFKGFAFSNFYYMPEFNWGKVKGRTLNYPFSEGDMPDGCKYVKLYLGFKGRGTVWYDNIDFRLSKWNFTTLERLSPMFEKEYQLTDLIVPKPKKVAEPTNIDFSNKDIYIVLPKVDINSNIAASELLKEYFTEATIVKENIDENIENALVFNIGETQLYKENINKLDISEISDKEQGYIIQKIEAKNPIIFLKGGASDMGNYYAATTIVQLIDKKTSTYQHSNIVDYPDFIGRSYLTNVYKNRWTIDKDTSLNSEEKLEKITQLDKDIQQELSGVEYFALYKINKVYNNYASLGKKWWEPGQFFTDLYEGLGKESERLGVINSCVMINPYFHFDYESEERNLPDSLRNIFSHSNPKDIDKVKKLITKAVDNNANTVMICADDFVPHSGSTRGIYALFTDADKKTYFNMAHAQSDMMNDLRTWLDKTNPEVRLEFCPAPYLNQFIDYGQGSAEAFFRDLVSHAPENMAIIWTGNTVRSLCYDMADIKRYSDLIGRKPMLWDNTPYARELEGQYGGYPAHYPGKAVMCNLFEPYDIIVPKDFHKIMDPHIYSNQTGFTERHKIKNVTFADFSWNCNEYDADFSLYKTLVGIFGKDDALELLQFNDNYYKLVSIWAKIRNEKEDAKEDNSYSIEEQDKENATVYIENLNKIYLNLEQSISNKRLLDELKKTMDNKIKQYQNIIKEGEKGSEKTGHRQT